MIKGVLLDLDNTLLHNPDREFAAAFKMQIERHFLSRFGRAGAADALIRGIHAASASANWRLTNAELMLRCLADGLALDLDSAGAALDDFYLHAYAELSTLASPMDGANELCKSLLEANVHVAIATNPIYPEAAISQRLAWAGLSEYIDAFVFVTHSENMHFAKPDQAYFAEAAARVGIEPDECLIIGDSPLNDVAPARSLGMRAWQVTDDGGLKPILDRLRQSDWQTELPSGARTAKMLQPQFMGNLAALLGLLADVKPHQWLQRPDPQEWSILQILCHLWQAESEVHQQRLRTILAHENPFIPSLPPPGPDIPACHDDGMQVFERFCARRQATIAMLADLTDQDWARPARHSIFGLTNLLEMAHFTAQHDRLHITQLCQTLGKCAD